MSKTMIASPETEEDVGRDLDIAAVTKVLWRGKWVIGLLASCGAAAALAYSFTLPEIFRAEVLLQIRQQGGSTGNLGGLAAVAAQLGGLAGAGGFSLGSGADREVAVATLRSRTVVEAFIEDRKLLPRLYESQWDSKTKSWKTGTSKSPSVWQAYNDFTKESLRISEDRKTGLVTLAVEWTNPVEAQQWVTELVARTNAHLKEHAIQEGERNLAYLRSQADQIGQITLVQALYGLVEEQLKQLMVAKGGDEFALRTIDPAVVPEKRIKPNRAPITLGGFLIGGMLGAVVMVWRATRTRKIRATGHKQAA